MAGTWTSQNKILPGAYVNFLTNTALSITPGERGMVVLLQEMSAGNAGDLYGITVADASEYPDGTTDADKLLVNEALKGAQKVIIYNLGTSHTSEVLTTALAILKTIKFNTLCYPYDAATYSENQVTIATWIKNMRTDEGIKAQAVLANYEADNEAIINVTQGIKLSNGITLTAAQVTAWVAGVTSGANINKSNTGQSYADAIDVVPRMTKSEMEAAVTAGEFIFKVDSAQNVTAVYDINSLTTYTMDKSKLFRKNRVIRTIDGINNDIVEIFESNYLGKTNNNTDGRALLRATLISYFNELQAMAAIQSFTADDVTISAGTDSDAVVIDCYIQPADSVEKIYITVNLS
ncbi:phage tail sheath C-terminal domain-containing protein [Clostridium aminobutyricum]|uniref:Phage tail sheath subtilisin-like domain-containing protein n=1 Tax=Clostridium aminobutyricum TaxID=33953 RepID=A0A939D8Q2_CLOAM|nr:phage tail sheath C-terminal domain-containing protein [Clostridium aminobutyricum]MBN7773150.1 phage tail sheath subtilisin-like domain-containing protein [Clostridium aminobutyricum]